MSWRGNAPAAIECSARLATLRFCLPILLGFCQSLAAATALTTILQVELVIGPSSASAIENSVSR
jgi:hypothetical protein